MNHLYAIKFTVSDKKDFFETLKRKAKAYVSAECPLQAMFFIRNKLMGSEWVSNGNEKFEKLDIQSYDSSFHAPHHIQAALNNNTVIDVIH